MTITATTPIRSSRAYARVDAAPVRSGALRLTRRGRLFVVLALLGVLLGLGFTLGRVSGSHAAGVGAVRTVVVQPGDTLWSIATRVSPDRDPRVVVAQLETVNGLHGGAVRAGEHLHVPA